MLALLCACATSAATAAERRELALAAGTQRELLIDGAIERLAIADEAVASVLVTRRDRNTDGARLIVTGLTPFNTVICSRLYGRHRAGRRWCGYSSPNPHCGTANERNGTSPRSA